MANFRLLFESSGFDYSYSMALVVPTTMNEEQVTEFQRLYKKHFDLTISKEQALKEGVQFLQFITAVIDNSNEFFD